MKLKELFRKPYSVKEVDPLIYLPEMYELRPNCRYIFWWEQSLNATHIEAIRRNLERVIGPLEHGDWVLITGVRAPKIFELQSASTQNESSSQEYKSIDGEKQNAEQRNTER